MSQLSVCSGDPLASTRRFLKLVREHGYWLASPEQDAAIGLDINWGGDVKLVSGPEPT
jgi:hypothetical protein